MRNMNSAAADTPFYNICACYHHYPEGLEGNIIRMITALAQIINAKVLGYVIASPVLGA